MIRIGHLSVSYAGMPVLKDISVEIPKAQFVLLTGASGCGKSTLARAISGLIPHALPAQMRGRVTIAGLDSRAHSLPKLARHVGLVFQNPSSQLFHLKVEDELAFGPRNLGLPEADVQQRVEWALQAVGLASLRERKPAELSGGQKQTVAVAAALALRPQVLVLDEPTASLDVPSARRVMQTLSRLQAEYGLTILVIEHRFAEVVSRAERALVMDDGQIIADGEPRAVLAARHIRQTLGLRRLAQQTPRRWQALLSPNGHRDGAEKPLLELKNVSAGYNHKPVIQDVNLAFYPGDFTALVGDNGSGKSTLARVAAGLLKPLRGQVFFRGRRRPRPGLDVALLFQNPSEQLFTDRVEEEVAFGPRNYDRYDASSLEETLQAADLQALRQRKPFSLSMGQQQRTALAACMALRPRLLILDEPTLGQDWAHLQRLMDFLQQLNAQGTAILLISHDYKLVHHYARRVLLLERGRITLEGKINPVHQKEKVR